MKKIFFAFLFIASFSIHAQHINRGMCKYSTGNVLCDPACPACDAEDRQKADEAQRKRDADAATAKAAYEQKRKAEADQWKKEQDEKKKNKPKEQYFVI